MGDEIELERRLSSLPHDVQRDIVWILQKVYGGGYVNKKFTWEELKDLRAKSYRALKALGLEK